MTPRPTSSLTDPNAPAGTTLAGQSMTRRSSARSAAPTSSAVVAMTTGRVSIPADATGMLSMYLIGAVRERATEGDGEHEHDENAGPGHSDFLAYCSFRIIAEARIVSGSPTGFPPATSCATGCSTMKVKG